MKEQTPTIATTLCRSDIDVAGRTPIDARGRHLCRPYIAYVGILALLLPALASAAEPATRPGLHMKTPPGWTQKQGPAKDPNAIPPIVISATGMEKLRMRVQPIPLGTKVLTNDQLRAILDNMVSPELGDAAKPEATKVEGKVSGLRATFEPTGQDAKGEKFHVTSMVVQLPGLALAVGITHTKDSKSLEKAVNVIRSATFGGAAKAKTP